MDIQKWVEEWVTLETEEQKKDFDVKFREWVASIPEDQKPAFQDMVYKSAVEELKKAKEIIEIVKIKKAIEPIMKYVSLSEIAKQYFGKTRQWLYQRLNGNIVNGVPAKFTNQELSILKNALNELSENIKRVAHSI